MLKTIFDILLWFILNPFFLFIAIIVIKVQYEKRKGNKPHGNTSYDTSSTDAISTDGGQTWHSRSSTDMSMHDRGMATLNIGGFRGPMNKFIILGIASFAMIYVLLLLFPMTISNVTESIPLAITYVCLAYAAIVSGISFIVTGFGKALTDAINTMAPQTIKNADYTLEHIDPSNESYRAGVKKIKSQAQNCIQMKFSPYKVFAITHLIICAFASFKCISAIMENSNIFRYYKEMATEFISSHMDINLIFGDDMTAADFFTIVLALILIVHAALLVLSFIVYLVRGSHADTSDIDISNLPEIYSPPQIIPEQTARDAVVQSKGTRTIKKRELRWIVIGLFLVSALCVGYCVREYMVERDYMVSQGYEKTSASVLVEDGDWVYISYQVDGSEYQTWTQASSDADDRIQILYDPSNPTDVISVKDTTGKMQVAVVFALFGAFACLGFKAKYTGEGTDPEDMDEYSGYDDFD